MKKVYDAPVVKVTALNTEDSILTLSAASVKKDTALKSIKKTDITF